jgi:predicted phosphoribosyltransferase
MLTLTEIAYGSRMTRSAAHRLLARYHMTFLNHADAGRQLADAMRFRQSLDTVVVGVTRGGVPVAAEIARRFGVALDLCVVRKLVVQRTAPITIGALAEADATYIDSARVARFKVSPEELAKEIAREGGEVARLSQLLRDRPPIDVRDRDVIVVDDGVVTGATIRAAIRSLTARGARRVELAVPVGSQPSIESLRAELDGLTCLESDPGLISVGSRYKDFWPVSDAEIVAALEIAPLDVKAVAIAERARVGRGTPRT